MRRVKRYLACLLSVCLLAGSVEFPAMAAESSVAVQEVVYAEGTTAGDDVSEGDVSKGDGAEGDGSGSSVSVNEVQSRIKSEEYETFVHVNPLYEDYVTDEVLAQWQAKAREQIYTADTQIESNTQEEAVAIIRDAMIARQTSLTVKVELDDAPSMSTTQFGKQLLYEAYADDPAGAGNAGDYLRSHYYGCTVGASISGGVKVVITYNYSFNYLSTAAQEQAVASKLSEVYAELNLGVLSGEAKVGKIYDYITNHVTYDYDHLDDGASVYPTAWSAYGGLIDGTCVCQGYASLVYRMMRESGVPARIITGYAGGDHAWNIVAIDGLYYNVDATWDAYTVNSDGSVNQPGQRTWYLLSTADFGNHARAEEYLTAEFQIAHPMAANSYGNATGNPDEMIELDNLSYEFTTSDNGKTSTTSSNGEFVLMVFGRVDCDYTMGYVEALVDAGITKNSNVRTLLVDIKNSLSDVQNRADDLDGDGVIVCYGAGSNGKTAMWDYCSLCGYDELSLEFPVVVLVDNNNKVRYFAVTAISIVGAKSCLQNLMQYEAPVIQSAEVVSGGIKLTWDAVNNADKYHVYSRIKEGAEYSKVATVTDTTYTYAVSNAGTYSLGVSMEHGSIESPMSEPVDVEYTKGAIGEVRLSQTEASLFSKQSTTLTATVVPVMSDDTVDQSVTWTSSDESVATVSNGTVTAVKPGSVTITATSVKDATKKATCAVTVKNDYIITYELNGGTLKTANPTTYNPFYPALALNAPEREGYGFLGWYRDANFAENTRMENIPAGSDYGNITLHAKWFECAAPVINNAEASLQGITLTWSALDQADKYYVYRKGANDANYTKVGNTTATTYLDKVTEAGTYYYVLTAEYDGKESGYSAVKEVLYQKGLVKEVTLNRTDASLFTYETVTLSATVAPVMSGDTVDQSVTWTSSDESVATVSNGTVTAVKPGSVTIMATSVKDATKKATCAVTVKNDYIITYELNGGTLKTANPTAYNPFYPALALNAPEREGYGFLGWYRDANFAENTRMENIPAGSDYGNITLHAKWFECAAPVINNAEASLQGITLTWSALDQADKYYVYRKGANDANYTKVGNTTATTYLDKVTEAGTYYYVLTAEYDGKESGYSAVKEVLYQKGLVKEVTLNRTDASLFTYETVSLSATVAPVMSGDTVDQSVTWTSSDESVATVSNGTVTAVKPGSVTITATSVKDATKKATCAVTVKNDYTITYELNGGTLKTANPTAYNPFYPELVLYAPEKADANFVGWYRDENFAEDTRMTTIPKGSDWGNITLYAKWKEKARVATPVTNIPSGVVEQGTKIKLSSDTLDAMIYYTVNGTDPDRNSTRYTDAIVVNEPVEIRAFAVKEGYKDSAVAVFNYTVQDTSLDLGDVLPEDVPDSGVIPEGLWVAGVEDTTYTGKAITFDLHVYHGKKRLALKTDYTVSYKNNKVAAEATAKKAPTVTVTGKGNYKDKVVKNFTIAPVNIRTTAGFDVEESYVAYNGKKQNVVPVLYQDGKKLKVKKDYQVSYPDTSEGAYTEPGTYEIILTGIGNYCDEFKTTVTISKAKLMSKTKIAAIPAQPYNNGEEIEPAIVVKDGKNVVDLGMYSVEYDNNSEIGTATVTITGDGIHYFGYKKATFKITGVAMSKVKVENLAKSMPYTGEEVVQNGLKLTYTAKKGEAAVELLEGRDYTVEYAKNVSAGTASITFKGMGRYTGNLKKTFKITAFDLKTNESSLVTVNYAQSLPYAKGGVKPEVQVFFAGTELVAGKDYTVSYKNNKAVNDGSNVKKLPTIAIKGKGNFKGTANYIFTITKQDIALMDVQVADKLVYTKAGGFKSTPKLYDVDGKQLKAGTDYEKNIGYYYEEDTYLEDGIFRAEGEAIGSRDILPAGTVVRVEVTGKGNYEANVVSGRYRIVKADVAKATVRIDPQIYTGKAVEPGKDQIKVTLKGAELTPADYEIVSYKNNVKKGTATVVLRGVGEYGGTKTAKFTIAARSIGDAEFYNELEEEYGH